jgi:hypothetical protein
MSSPPEIRNIVELATTAHTDPAVGIRIVQVTNDDHDGLYVAEPGSHLGEVYQRENTGLLPMIAVIICLSAHIGHDRFIVKGAIPHQPGCDFYAALPF